MSNRLSARFDELRKLEDGWLDGEGRAPRPKDLEWLEAALANMMRKHPGFPCGRVYPTEEGGVIVEWTTDAHDASLEVDLSARSGRWHDLNLLQGHERCCGLDLSDAASWSFVGRTLQALAPACGESP